MSNAKVYNKKNNQSVWIEKIFSQNIQTKKSDQRFQETFWSHLEYIRDRVFHLSLSQTRAWLVRGWILLAAKISHPTIVAKFIPDYEPSDQKLATPATSIQCDKILLSMVHAAICNTFISIDLFLILSIIYSLSTKLCVFAKSFGRDSEQQ